MTNILEVFDYVKSLPVRRKRKTILFILHSIFRVPAMVFHEISHLIIIWITKTKMDKYVFKFLVVKEDKKSLDDFNCWIWLEDDVSNRKMIAITIAPLFTYLILLVCLIIFGQWLILLYAIIEMRYFYLSNIDFNTLNSCNVNKKLCNILKIHLVD